MLSEDCRQNLCAAPTKSVPASPNVTYYAEFNVPPLPASFSASQTYFIYYNIIFPADGDVATNNQFVPQLMLGEPLCGSTGPPYYNPVWKTLKTWHIGAQYFFFVKNESDPSGNSGKAVTGDLIDVYEGQIVYTQFSLSDDGEVWTLQQGIKGNATAVSTVRVPQPFMGFDPNTKSWTEPVYNMTRLGCCWELYGINERANYPNFMDYQIITKTSEDWSNKYWSPWKMVETPTCSYAPQYTLEDGVNEDGTEQIAFFDIFYE